MSTAAVILAAGAARRAGGPKTVWPLAGQPAVRRVALAALGAAEVTETIVVCGGPWAEEVRAALAGLKLKLVFNPNSATGQASSLAAGLAALGPEIRAVIFLLADQPFMTSQIIDDLLEFYQKSGMSLAAPFFRGRRRNPVVFALERWRAELMGLSGDQGGRGLIDGHSGELALWPCDGLPEKCFRDFDSPEDYESLRHEEF